MLFSTATALVGLVAAAALSSAKPVPDKTIAARCGATLLPNHIYQLSQDSPNTSYNTGSLVQLSQNTGSTHQIASLISFPPTPPGSYGCTLSLLFPPSYDPSISGTTPVLSVFAATTPLPTSPTWNNVIPSLPSGTFGTVTVVHGGEDVVINSETCGGEDGLAFVFRYAAWVTGEGSVAWTEDEEMEAAATRGAILTYNC